MKEKFIEWASCLKEPIRTQFINNVINLPLWSDFKENKDAGKIINDAFEWSRSPEKHAYWEKIRSNPKDYMETELTYELY